MIGKTISHYKILEKLGEGGMGVVYKAEDTKLDRFVALKFLPHHLSQSEQEKKRFIHEAKAASALDHPNICTIYEIDETKPAPGEPGEGQMFIAMAYYESESLQAKIEPRPLPIEETIGIAIQISQGLAKAHSKDIIHRDIKPANILITEDQVKIVDFGLAKLAGRTMLTKEGTTLGTVAYMSPEQAQGTEVDHRTDIWAVGAVLYEMITGQRPFEADYEQAVLYSILNEDPKPIKELREETPEGMDHLVQRALHKKPDLRFESMGELLQALRACQSPSTSYEPGVLDVKSVLKLFRRPGIAIPAVLIIAILGFFALRDSGTNTGTTLSETSSERLRLAVLPFENIGGDPDQEFFVDGMTEEMITILGSASPERLGVIARTSAMHFKGTGATIETVSRELGVGYILEGSVRRQGETVRISAKLIQAQDQTQLWSNSFNGTLDDIFALQSTVANQIAEALAVTLLPGSRATGRAHTPNPQAYEEYLSGRFWANKGTEEGFIKAIIYYEKAVEIDPEYALAYAALSHAYSTWASWNTVHPTERLKKAKVAVEKAFRLGPELADAHSALALIKLLAEWDWQGAEEEFRRALALNPTDGLTYHWYGHYLSFANRDQEALDAFAGALRLDPLSALHRGCLGLTQLDSGELGLAEKSIGRALELSPQLPVAHNWLGLLRERQGRLEEAVAAWEDAVRHSRRGQFLLGSLGYGYGRLGQPQKARRVLEELELRLGDGYVSAIDRARVVAGLGDFDQAFNLLEIAYANREPWIFALKIGPGFDTIREDPRFEALLRQIGVTP